MGEQLAAWLRHAGIDRVAAGLDSARATCPFHADAHQTLAVYSSGRYRCWSSRCGRSGTLKQLGSLLGIPPPDRLSIHLVEEVHIIPEERLALYPFAFEQLQHRQMSRDDVVDWDLRWDTRPHRNALLIPVRNADGDLVGCLWRYSDARRYRNSPGLDRRHLLYGLNYCTGTEVHLCEGPGDAWRLKKLGYRNAVASFGATFCQEQVGVLVDRGVESVTIWYDNDKAGFSGAILASDLLRGLITVTCAMRYCGKWPKDPGEMDACAARRLHAQSLSPGDLLAEYYKRWPESRLPPVPLSAKGSQRGQRLRQAGRQQNR